MSTKKDISPMEKYLYHLLDEYVQSLTKYCKTISSLHTGNRRLTVYDIEMMLDATERLIYISRKLQQIAKRL